LLYNFLSDSLLLIFNQLLWTLIQQLMLTRSWMSSGFSTVPFAASFMSTRYTHACIFLLYFFVRDYMQWTLADLRFTFGFKQGVVMLPKMFVTTFGSYVTFVDTNFNHFEILVERINGAVYLTTRFNAIPDFSDIQIGGWVLMVFSGWVGCDSTYIQSSDAI